MDIGITLAFSHDQDPKRKYAQVAGDTPHVRFAEKADVEINAKVVLVAEAIGLLRCCEWTLRLRRFSTLNDLLLAHSPYPTTDADAVFLALTPIDFAS